MEKILVARQKIKRLYAENDVYILPVIKFLTMFLILRVFAQQLGYSDLFCRWDAILIVSLIAALMPWPVLTFLGSIALLSHMLALAWEAALLTLIFLLIAAIAQYLFLPGFSQVILLIPVFYCLHVPFVIPLIIGLIGGASSFIPVGTGVFLYYFIQVVQKNTAILMDSNMISTDTLAKFSQLIMAIKDNQLMLTSLIAFVLATVVCYAIRKIPVDYAHYAAVGTGAATLVITYFISGIRHDITIPYTEIIIGAVIALIAGGLAVFWLLAVDYSRTEHLQYEDDEYIYYVKAVPKIIVAKRDVKVSEITEKASDEEDYVIREALEMLDTIDEEIRS